MKKGYSFESFAGLDEVNTSFRVLYDWLKAHPDFLHAKEEGMAKSLYKWETDSIKGLYDIEEWDKSTNIVHKKKLNAAIYRLNMINRFKWADSAANINKKIELEEKPKRLIIERK
jgi:hypothetical protein